MKKGDKVVFINDKSVVSDSIELYKTYTLEATPFISIKIPKSVLLVEVNGLFSMDRFVSVVEFRKMKLNKIINKINK